MSQGKTIVLGVTGGIAAYKAADLVSRLIKKDHEVHVIMTKSAEHFVSPLTFRTLSGNPVITGMFSEPGAWNVRHISLAEKADLMVIAPATANIIGKITHGIADDMLSTTLMAARCPVLIAPAMNVNMYLNPVVQENIRRLEDLGYRFVGPATGRLACGTEGKGRMEEVCLIEEKINELLCDKNDFCGKKILITAGPTREALDPIRFLSNRSTGTMGYALAKAAKNRGAIVHLVSGPTCLPSPYGVKIINVESAREMHQAVWEVYPKMDIIIKAAAVADYRPKETVDYKIKKKEGDLTLMLERNPDILWELGQNKKHQLLVGFAAETDNLLEYAKHKMTAKNLDMIVANNVKEEGAGFGGTTNIVTIITKEGEIHQLPQMTKLDTAHAILDQIRMLAGINWGDSSAK